MGRSNLKTTVFGLCIIFGAMNVPVTEGAEGFGPSFWKLPAADQAAHILNGLIDNQPELLEKIMKIVRVAAGEIQSGATEKSDKMYLNMLTAYVLDQMPYWIQSPDFLDIIAIAGSEVKNVSLEGIPHDANHTDLIAKVLLGKTNYLRLVQRVLGRKSARTFIPNQPPNVVNQQCYDDTMDFMDALNKPLKWAIDVFDAIGKPSGGIQKGSLYYTGSFDQCNAIQAHIPEGIVLGNISKHERDFKTRFCRVSINVPDSFMELVNVDTRGIQLQLHWGLCVSEACHKDDINGLFHIGPLYNRNISIAQVFCDGENDLSSDGSARAAIGILVFFGLLIVMSTFYDGMTQYLKSEAQPKETKDQPVAPRYNVLPGEKGHAYALDNIAYTRDIKSNGTMGQTEVVIGETSTTSNGTVQAKKEDLPPAYMKHKEDVYENGTITDNLTIVVKRNDSEPAMASPQEKQIQPTISESKPKRDDIWSQLLKAFSIYSNAPKILNGKISSASVGCIHGIRFFSLTWVVLGHTFNYGILSIAETTTAKNLLDADPLVKRFTFQGVIAGGFAVDTFFLLSAFLVTWLHLKETDKKRKKCAGPDVFMYYFHRIWRLTPLYMMVLMTFTCLYKYFGNGPMWPSHIVAADNCKDNWWTNLLYVNNLVHVDHQCMGWTWYLADDMQFYVISLFFIMAMYYNAVFGLIMTLLLLCAGIASSFWKEYIYNGSFFTMKSDGGGYWNNVYIVPWCRVGAWAVGMVLGLIVYKRPRKAFKNKLYTVAGWLLAAGAALFLVYISYTENKEGGKPWTPVERAFYEGFGRPLWAACVGWVIFACYNNMGGIVNSFLSWSGFVALGRLTYAAYLVHPICMMIHVYSKRSLLYINDFDVIYLYFGHLCLTFMVAFAFSVSFEAPFMALEKILLRRGKR